MRSTLKLSGAIPAEQPLVTVPAAVPFPLAVGGAVLASDGYIELDGPFPELTPSNVTTA